MFHHYNPYEPYTTVYAEYTSTTTVPQYELQHSLLSLSDQQSRINARREELDAEERLVQQRRAAILQRIRAQKYQQTFFQSDDEKLIEQILEEDRHEDQAMNDSVMYALLLQSHPCAKCSCRQIFHQRKHEGGHPSGREYLRELQVREMVDPSPMAHSFHHPQYQVPSPPPMHPHPHPHPHTHTHTHTHTHPHPHSDFPPPPTTFIDTPVVNELPTFMPFAQPQYFPEPSLSANKRGTRRSSTRRNTFPTPDTQASPLVTLEETMHSLSTIRAKFQAELHSIPPTIRTDVRPSPQELKALQIHTKKLEDIIADTDAVALPTTSSEDYATARKERKDVVDGIVAAIDGIERLIQPDTPSGSVVTGAESAIEESDIEDNAFYDQDIQRVIQETLARKKDEGGVPRPVTVEDVSDFED
jgi:hypothetical protein